MDPQETAAACEQPVQRLAANFMLDPATYQKGQTFGFSGIDFYVAGRGGPLGAVDADVVVDAFVFFEPGMIRDNWESGTKVMPPKEAAVAFAWCGHDWARQHLSDDVDWKRLGDLVAKVVDNVDLKSAPLVVGWRALPRPGEGADGAKPFALHLMTVLRELQMNRHGAAVRAAGLPPRDALFINTPFFGPLFGWGDAGNFKATEEELATYAEVRAATVANMAPAYEPLTAGERLELSELAAASLAAVQ